MESLFTRENILKAQNDPDILHQLIKQSRLIIISMYFSQAASEESLREKKARLDAQRDAAVICDNCGELTVYSIPLILPGGMKNMVCLSDKCITNSILHTGDTIVEEEESRTEYDDLFFE